MASAKQTKGAEPQKTLCIYCDTPVRKGSVYAGFEDENGRPMYAHAKCQKEQTR
jgi:hypothetical protein